MTLRLALLAGAAAMLPLSVSAQDADPVLTQAEVETTRGVRAQGADAPGRIKQFLRAQGADEATVGSLVVTRKHQGRAGVEHLTFEQRVDGKRVVGGLVKASVGADGALIAVSERIAKKTRVTGRAALTAERAVALAVRTNHPGKDTAPGQLKKDGNVTSFAAGTDFHVPPTAEEVVVARKSGQMEPGWLVTTWTEDDNKLIETVIDARGKIVSTELRTAEDSYNVFADHPGVSSQQVVSNPANATASPNGWLSGVTQYATLITGNNARAYLDTNNSNTPDTPSRVVSDGNFVTAANLGQQPSTTQNREVAVQNLFYLNNLIHDELYAHGFTESAGNFQENNFGRGGAGSDSVEAQAQDGGGTNNANMATPADGSNPRMQMYVWTRTTPQRDGDLDSDIVWHEYGHGLTWRMIGSMSGSISGAIGEGMSDVLAIVKNDQPVVGEYSYNSSTGIRRYSYEGYPLTLGDFTGSSVHSDGEIYAATLWDLWKAYKAAGLGEAEMMGDVVEGMNFTAPGPDYLDMRNGILDAAPADRDCMVWKSFAKFGMGEGASMTAGRFSVSVTESFAEPAACTGGGGGGGEPPVASTLTSLSVTSAAAGRKNWNATASFSTDQGGAVVGYRWSSGTTGTCTTDGSGACTAVSPNYSNGSRASVTFTVETIDGQTATSGNGTALSQTVNAPTSGGGGDGGGGKGPKKGR